MRRTRIFLVRKMRTRCPETAESAVLCSVVGCRSIEGGCCERMLRSKVVRRSYDTVCFRSKQGARDVKDVYSTLGKRSPGASTDRRTGAILNCQMRYDVSH